MLITDIHRNAELYREASLTMIPEIIAKNSVFDIFIDETPDSYFFTPAKQAIHIAPKVVNGIGSSEWRVDDKGSLIIGGNFADRLISFYYVLTMRDL